MINLLEAKAQKGGKGEKGSKADREKLQRTDTALQNNCPSLRRGTSEAEGVQKHHTNTTCKQLSLFTKRDERSGGSLRMS
jgi:hypothetical protein